MPYKNKEQGLKYQEVYRERNKEKISEYVKQYHLDNKEKIRKQRQEYAKKRRIDIRNFINNIKKQCVICGYNKTPASIDFHHVADKGIKGYSINDLVKRNPGKKRILDELNKCIIVCSNCHRELHDKERNTQ